LYLVEGIDSYAKLAITSLPPGTYMDAALQNTFMTMAATTILAILAWGIRTHRDRVAVKVALVTEIITLKKIAEVRGYADGLFETYHELSSLDPEERPKTQLMVKIPEHYCRVYQANLQKLGTLGLRDAFLVVSFYQYVDSFVRDVLPGGILHEGTSDPEAFKETGQVLKAAVRIAYELEHTTANSGWFRWVPGLSRKDVFSNVKG
jgi:hypothetical protein